MVGEQYWIRISWSLAALGLCVACGQRAPAERAVADDPWSELCIDEDGDGYGFHCSTATDCNDADPTLHDQCPACSVPEEGCACEPGSAPLDCYPDPSFTASGSLLCKAGVRYCRDGVWSGCESLTSFEIAPPARKSGGLASHRLAVIDPNAGQPQCSPCKPNCHRIDDPIDATDDTSGVGSDVAVTDSGGLTVYSEQPDPPPADPPACVPGSAPDVDCDGIPDSFDEAQGEPPFATDHEAIFMDLEPGETESASFDITFFMRTADVYFLIDMTGSMSEERDQLVADLTSGNFLPDPNVDCADRDYDGSVADDNANKTGGIAGNIACLIRNARLGAGWFREIPFECGDDLGGELCYGPTDIAVYEHAVDITSDVAAVQSAIQGFDTVGNYDWPEAHMQALYATVTGSQLYNGWDRPGVPTRSATADCAAGTWGCCPEGTWGYPCFNDAAVPLVVLISDAAMNNGPATQDGTLGEHWVCNRFECWNAGDHPIDYDPEALATANFGPTGAYTPIVGNPNEDFTTRYEAGRVDDTLLTFIGDTSQMSADLPGQAVGCGVAFDFDDGPDAVVRFHVEQPKTLTVSARGTRFDSVMAIIKDDGTLGVQQNPTNYNLNLTGNTNDTVDNPADLGILPPDVNATVIGSSADLAGEFPRETVGCFNKNSQNNAGQPKNGSDKAPDSAFKFQVSEDMTLTFDVQASGFDGVLSLFTGTPAVPQDCTFASGCAADADKGFAGSDGATGDTYASALDVGDITGRSVRVMDGDLEAASVHPDYDETEFDATGCAATGTAEDQVVNFSVSERTDVRIETSGVWVKLQPNFNNLIGLVDRGQAPANAPTVVAVAGNDDEASAATIDEADLGAGAWMQYAGSTAALNADYTQDDVGGAGAGACGLRSGGATDSADAVFKLDLSSRKTLDFDTDGSGFVTYLSIHQDGVEPPGNRAVSVASNNANSSADAAQHLGTIDRKQITVTGGDTGAAAMDTLWPRLQRGCGRRRSNAVGAVFTFTVDTRREVEINTRGSTLDTVLYLFDAAPDASAIVDCDDDIDRNTSDSRVTAVLDPGTYYLLVRGRTSGSVGRYALQLIDKTNQAGGSGSTVVDCDSGSFAGNDQYSQLRGVTLDAGTYYVVVKGGAAVQASYDYKLNVRVPRAAPSMIECNEDGLAQDRALIRRTLDPGEYSVIVRGKRTNDAGQYKLTIRDEGYAPAYAGCMNEAGGQDASPFTVDLKALDDSGDPIDYYLIMRGNDTDLGGGGGDYEITIGDGSGGDTVTAMTCRDDDIGLVPEYTGRFDAGDYMVVLKGYNANEHGWYQLTVGDPDLAKPNMSYWDPNWLGPSGDGTGGVLEKLTDKGVRVLSVLSDNNGETDTYAQEQMETLASATGATDLGGNPLVFNIKGDGSGMGSAIIQAVQRLAQNLEMDVGVRLVQEPDDPTPDFLFKVRAVDQPGDLCDPPIDTDNDAEATPDTHTNCGPGATPKFEVTFTNREFPNNVPLNPDDPYGGYHMRLELIGEGQYIVDSIPVYIIPTDVVADPGDPVYSDSAQYWQDVESTGCTGNAVADWQSLYWNADLPTGTSMRWEACLKETAAELSGCTASDYQPVVTVTAGDPCLSDADCNQGFCQASRCQIPVGPSCALDDDCGEGGACAAGACTWSALPVDPAPALIGLNGLSHLRMRVTLFANQTHSSAPTVHDWRLDYLCTGGE